MTGPAPGEHPTCRGSRPVPSDRGAPGPASAALSSVGRMKAAVYYETGAPDVLRYEDVPDPVPGPGDVLIKVEAISIEGGDTLNRAGGLMPSSPHIVGYHCAGTIVGVGADVTDHSVRQRWAATLPWGS